MTGNTPFKNQDTIEPIAADTIGAIANFSQFNTLNGCGATYSISDMKVTIAVGAVTHTNAYTAVAGNDVTLVSDPSNPRFTYIYFNSSGVAVIISGSPSATPAVPDFGANVTGQLVYVQGGLTIAGNATYKLDKRVMAPSTLGTYGLVQKYKSATQTISASTGFVDMTATSGNLAAAIAPSEVWQYEWLVPLTFTGTGGAKFQVTGPATPTAVAITPYLPLFSATGGNLPFVFYEAATVAFSTPFGAHNASAALTDNTYNSSANGGLARITAYVANGSTAGTVTLQFAQNSANGTTIAGIGARLTATRIV